MYDLNMRGLFNTTFRNIIAGSPVAMAVLDVHLSYVAASEKWVSLYGLEGADLIGKPQEMVFSHRGREWSKALTESLQGKDQICNGLYFKRKDGSVVWLRSELKHWLDDQDRIGGLVMYCEEICYQNDTQFKQAFEQSLIGMALVSPEGNWKRVNKSLCLILGYSEAEMMKLNIRDITYPEDIDKSVQALDRLTELKTGDLKFEKRYVHKDGHLVWVVVATTLLRDRFGRPLHYISQIEDITERKFQENTLLDLNAELVASNDQKNKLLSVIGHDLRNPISGSLQLLDLTLTDFESTSPEDVHQCLYLMKQELSNANNLLEDLLTWAKSQFNRTNFNPVEIDQVFRLIKKSMLNISHMAAKKDIEINIDVETGLKVWAEAGMLETIFRNLLSNAIKFSDKGKKIFIEARSSKEGTRFAVKDSGKGIPEKKMAQLFDKNINFTTFGTDGEKGTGLGLNLCYDFVLKHGGRLWAESEEGIGSVFYFVLPGFKAME